MKKLILSLLLYIIILLPSNASTAQKIPESCMDSTPSLKDCYAPYFMIGASSYADDDEEDRIKENEKEEKKKAKEEKKKTKASKKDRKKAEKERAAKRKKQTTGDSFYDDEYEDEYEDKYTHLDDDNTEDDDEYSYKPKEKSSYFLNTAGKHFTELSSGTELLPVRLLGKKPRKLVQFTASDGCSYDVPAKWKSKYLSFFLEEAQKAGVQVRIHLLVCPEMSPKWFFFHNYDTASYLASKDEMTARLEWYIKTVTDFISDWEYDHNHGIPLVTSYDVASELFTDTGDVIHTPSNYLTKIFGDASYALQAFHFTSTCVPPSVKLCYCDHSLFEPKKAEKVKEFINAVWSTDVKGRVDEIGIISHLTTDWPKKKEFFDSCKFFAAENVDVQIQQLDIAAMNGQDSGNAYYDFMEACIKNAACIKGVSFRSVKASENTEFVDYMRSPLFSGDLACTENFVRVIEAAGQTWRCTSHGATSQKTSSSWSNLFDYVTKHGGSSFEEAGINELDSAIFSMLSYIIFEGTAVEGNSDGVQFQELSNRFFSSEFRYSMKNENWDIWQSCIRMLETAATYKRYAGIKVKGYVSLLDEYAPTQFSAVIFSLTPTLHFIAFRGTDTTIAGWRDNFLMTCEEQTQTQKLALEYLEKWAPHLAGTIHTGGHSKGANLAIYASAKVGPEIQKRIEGIWNYEGPGFSHNPDMLDQIKAIDGKIKTFIPETSLVGVVMRSFDSYTVVKSENHLFLQHDLFSWHIDDSIFECVDELSRTSRMFDSTMNSTIANLSDAQFHIIIDVLFDSMEDSGIHNIQDIKDNMGRFSASLTEACLFSGKTTRRTLLYVGKCLVKNFNAARKEEKKRK